MSKPKILLIGWDAADWNVARPLLEQGKMPALQRLMEQGVWGNLATIRPVLSPMLWTSIATGKRAWKHGIHGFAEPCSATGGIRPITNLSRKSKAIWNIFNQQGWRNNIIGWWPSHPAEPINGVMISNHFQQATASLGKDWPMRPGTVHPKELEEPLREMRIHPAELDNEHILPFIPRAAEIDQSKDKRMESCAKIIAEISGIHAAATAVMQLEEWDFMAVYYDGIDHFGHGFMKYHPPRQPWVKEEDFELYKDVIEAAYRYHDMMLDVLLQLAGDDTTVMLISDHGFEPGNLRPQTLPNEPAGPAAEHSPFGMFCLRGPGIRTGERIYGATLLDIAPTLLHIAGLPVGRDMDGKVLVNCFARDQQVAFTDSWEAIPGEDGRHPADARLDVTESRESLRQLVELGYIDEPNPDKACAVDETIRELQYNLAQAYMDGGRHTDAARILEAQWERWPNESRFGTQMLFCHIALEDAGAARATYELLLRRKKAAIEHASTELQKILREQEEKQTKAKAEAEANGTEYQPEEPAPAVQQRLRRLRGQAGSNPHALAYLLGNVLTLEGRHSEALEALSKAEEVQTANRPSVYAKMGDIHYTMENWDAAETNYRKVLSLAPNNHHAQLGLARICMRRGHHFEAAGHALASLELIYHNPKAHTVYGTALMALGKSRLAENSLLTAIAQNPGYPTAHERLAELYDNLLHQPERAAHHRQQAKIARQKYADIKVGKIAPPPPDQPQFHAIAEVTGRLSDTHGEPLIVVSGLPRSGTSLMMQMLVAGGISAVTDSKRTADPSNPKGYFEDERVKRLPMDKDRSWLGQHCGKAIKIIGPLLSFIPPDIPLKVIFMQRDSSELIASQRAMLIRDGKTGAADTDALVRAFSSQITAVNQLVLARPNMEILPVFFHDAVHHPETVAQRVNAFLGGKLDIPVMAQVADKSLHRNHTTAGKSPDNNL